MNYLLQHKLQIFLSLSGVVIAFAYWFFIGCKNGCTIKSDWRLMILYGGVMGWLVGGLINDFKNKKR